MCYKQGNSVRVYNQKWSPQKLDPTDLLKELLPCGGVVDGELQFCVHGDDANIDLQPEKEDECVWKNSQYPKSFSCICLLVSS